jgi:hypothetical protein
LCTTLTGAAEQLCGVVEGDEPVGHVGHEAAADLVGEPDAPRRVRGGLLGGQQPVRKPAADGGRGDAQLVRGLLDGDGLAVWVDRCGGGDAGALADAAHAGFIEGQTGAGPAALLVEVAAIWPSG